MNFEKEKIKHFVHFPVHSLRAYSCGLHIKHLEFSHIESSIEQFSSFLLHFRSNGTKIKKASGQKIETCAGELEPKKTGVRC